MSEETDGEVNVSEVLGKAELRASYTTLTYISDDVTSPEYVSPDFHDSFDNPHVKQRVRDAIVQNGRASPNDIHMTVSGSASNTNEQNGVLASEEVPVTAIRSSPIRPRPITIDNTRPSNGVQAQNGVESKYSTDNEPNNTSSIPSAPVIDVNEHSNIYFKPGTSETNGPSHVVNDLGVTRRNENGGNTTTPGIFASPSPQNANGQTNGANLNNIQYVQSPYRQDDTPLTQRRIKYLKIFSVVAAIFFFPIGIFAALKAFKIEKAFQDGIMQGNIDAALKLAKKTQTLLFLSFVVGVLFIVIIIVVIERIQLGKAYHWHSGTIVGH